MKIQVGNLACKTTEKTLRNTFEKFGTVSSLKITPSSEPSISQPTAIVVMTSGVQGKDALSSLNGSEMDGNRLTVTLAREF